MFLHAILVRIMQTITTAFRNVQSFSLILGLAFGLLVAVVIHGGFIHAVGAHVMYGKENSSDVIVNASPTSTTIGTPKNTQPVASNHYMMAKITSERQFLKEMKLHHEAAVKMSEQALLLTNLRPEVRALAKNIIATQKTEIKTMTDWITAWKY